MFRSFLNRVAVISGGSSSQVLLSAVKKLPQVAFQVFTTGADTGGSTGWSWFLLKNLPSSQQQELNLPPQGPKSVGDMKRLLNPIPDFNLDLRTNDKETMLENVQKFNQIIGFEQELGNDFYDFVEKLADFADQNMTTLTRTAAETYPEMARNRNNLCFANLLLLWVLYPVCAANWEKFNQFLQEWRLVPENVFLWYATDEPEVLQATAKKTGQKLIGEGKIDLLTEDFECLEIRTSEDPHSPLCQPNEIFKTWAKEADCLIFLGSSLGNGLGTYFNNEHYLEVLRPLEGKIEICLPIFSENGLSWLELWQMMERGKIRPNYHLPERESIMEMIEVCHLNLDILGSYWQENKFFNPFLLKNYLAVSPIGFFLQDFLCLLHSKQEREKVAKWVDTDGFTCPGETFFDLEIEEVDGQLRHNQSSFVEFLKQRLVELKRKEQK